MCVEKNVFEFNESGLLPQGCHEITLEEIKKYFVDNFPESTTRQSRFDCFMRFYKDLLKNVKSCIRCQSLIASFWSKHTYFYFLFYTI